MYLVSFLDPTHYAEKGLVTFERFPGGAESAVMLYVTVYAETRHLSKNFDFRIIADFAADYPSALSYNV